MMNNGSGKGVFVVDSGLRKYMISVFNKMFLALCLTGGVSFLCIHSPVIMNFMSGGFSILLMFAMLGIVFYIGAGINKMAPDTASSLFWIYAALVGAALSPLALVYTGASIANAFFMTACFFGGMSLYGYTTKKDLTSVGSFMFVGLICLLLTSFVNSLFLKSAGLEMGISALMLIIFAGLTAYDVQKIRSFYDESDSQDVIVKKSVVGALSLYMDFVNMFVHILRFVGRKR